MQINPIIDLENIKSDSSYALETTILTQGKSNKIDIICPKDQVFEVLACIYRSKIMDYGNRTMNWEAVNGLVCIIYLRKMDILFDSMAIEDELKTLSIKYTKRQIIYQGKQLFNIILAY